MADYYPLLAKAVAGLPDPTAEARQAVYERARKALFGQLRTLDPPVPEDAIEREAQALERAVAQLETEIVARSIPETGAPPAEADFAGLGPPAEALRTKPSTPPPQPSAAGPNARAPGRSARVTPSAPARPPRPAPPPLKVRREPPVREAVPPAKTQRPSPPSSMGPEPFPGRSPGPPNSPAANSAVSHAQPQLPGAGTMPPGQAASLGYYPAGPEASGGEAADLNAPSFESFVLEAESANPESYEPASRMRLEAQRPYAPLPEENKGAAKRIGIVAGIVAVLIALVAAAAYKLRDRPEDLARLQPPTVQGEAAVPGSKIADRIGGDTATPGAPAASPGTSAAAGRDGAPKSGSMAAAPPVPVARRAALLMEAPEEQSKVKTILGTVVWRADNVSNGPDEPLSTAVHAEINIPDEGLQADMTIQKNFDNTLPASHTIKLRFSMRPGGALADIKQVTVLLRRENTPTGDALKGVTVPVMENSFLIGLSRGDGEASNLDLLRSREWFDIPMVLANGHIAKLTFEKGPAGRSALDDAIGSWQAQ